MQVTWVDASVQFAQIFYLVLRKYWKLISKLQIIKKQKAHIGY